MRAAFVDRDGTLSQVGGYCHPEDFRLAPQAGEAVRLLNQHGWPVVLVTNQSGVGKGQFSEDALLHCFHRMEAALQAEGAWLDGIYYCPHSARSGVLDCPNRKPQPGMLLQASADLGLDLPGSLMIGDSGSDMLAGHAAGCGTILVRTGWGISSLSEYRKPWAHLEPGRIEEDLLHTARWVIETFPRQVVQSPAHTGIVRM